MKATERKKLAKDLSKGELLIKQNDSISLVSLNDYCRAKAKAMVEFGYPKTTADTIRYELKNMAVGRELGIIGMFVESDLAY